MAKSEPRVMKWEGAEFLPRFEYGEMAQAAQLCGEVDGTELAAGFVRMQNANIPWTVRYDEIVLVLEGEFRVRTEDDLLVAKAMDSIWLPAGTKLNYEAEEALVFYAIHPADWASQ